MLYLLCILGTVGFSLQGIYSGKKYPLLSSMFIGVGGGTIRDIILLRLPFWYYEPIYIIIPIVMYLICKHLIHFNKALVELLGIVGLLAFTYVGFKIGLEYNIVCAILFGIITACCGSLLNCSLRIKDLMLSFAFSFALLFI